MGRAFDGSGDFINTVDVTELNSTQLYTVAVWCIQTTIDERREIFGKYASGTDKIGVRTWDNGNMYSYVGNGSSSTYHYWDYSADITAGTRFHYVTRFEGTEGTAINRLEVYIDGVKITLTEGPSSMPDTTGAMATALDIGEDTLTNGDDWDGSLSHFTVWDINLLAPEILLLSRGVNPITIRPGNIIQNIPMWGNQSPEPDYSGLGHTGTVTNTTKNSFAPVEHIENIL